MLSAEKIYVFDRMNGLARKFSLGTELHHKPVLVKAKYDFDVHGGAVGDISLDDEDGNDVVIPDNAIIVRAYIDIITAMASAGGAGTIALKAESAGDLKAAVDADTLSGIVAGIPQGAAANCIKMSADRTLKATIAVEALTAGKFNLFVEYVLSE